MGPSRPDPSEAPQRPGSGNDHSDLASLEDVLITEELARRPSRPPDHAAEARALAELAEAMGDSPGSVLQRLAELALELCRADSAGISLLERRENGGRFHWPVIAGRWAHFVGGQMPLDASPCGVVIDRDAPQLFASPERHFPAARIHPLIVEVLLIPFHAEGRPIGTLWSVSHTPAKKFDAEDSRLLTSLARFASAAYRLRAALEAAEVGKAELERGVAERTRALSRANEALRESEERLRIAAEAAELGTWDLDLTREGGSVRSPRHDQIFGYDAPEPDWGLGVALRHILPEDRGVFEAAFARATATGRLSVEVRVRWPDDDVHWIAPLGRTYYDDSGRPVRMVGVVADITARKRLEEELREAAHRKDEFLAMLGHELRNPLTPLRGVTEMLQRHRLDADGLARAYAIMARQVEHLTRLVDDLLDVSRINRGLIELRREPVDLAEAANQAVEMIAPAIDGRGHELSLTLPRRPLIVEGDPIRLTQVIFNLLNNAAKYTEPGGRIWVSVAREGEQAVVRVRDDGSGMAPELIPRVFDLFVQGDRTPDRSQGGLGLGLALVKRLAELHGGGVEAASEGLGKGSEFVVRLPARPADVAAPPPVRTPAPPGDESQVERALVIDDNRDVAESLTWALTGLAREVRMVHSGPEALETVERWRPDLILCDIGMPEMDGHRTCRCLRQIPGLEKTLIVAVSGYGGEAERRKSKEAGFDRHLVKPIGRATVEELIRTVREVQRARARASPADSSSAQ